MRKRYISYVASLGMLIVLARPAAAGYRQDDLVVKPAGNTAMNLDWGQPADCEAGILCTSWQEVTPVHITSEPSQSTSLLVMFNGNYNWNGSALLLSSPYVSVRVEISRNGGPFEVACQSVATWVPNVGSDVVLRCSIPACTSYSMRVLHRLSVQPSEHASIASMSLTQGMLTVQEITPQ